MKKHSINVPVVLLRTETGYNAFSPSIDGCVATARTVETALKRFKEAVEFHLEGQSLVKNRRKQAPAALREAFDDYGTDAIYASVLIPNA
jgi:predicted RNase H-like HicB family nuclease